MAEQQDCSAEWKLNINPESSLSEENLGLMDFTLCKHTMQEQTPNHRNQ